MARDARFIFLCSKAERKALRDVAHSMRRSQADALRVLIVDAALKLDQAGSPTPIQQPEPQELESGRAA